MPEWIRRFFGYTDWFLDWVAAHASIATATIAVFAVVVALRSLHSQRDTARKRAALDLFFKTEMDKSIAKGFEQFDDDIILLKEKEAMPMAEFAKTYKDAYNNMISCLNIHELVAVGIHEGVLDPKVCYEFWGDELMSARRDTMRVVDHYRKNGGTRYSYSELEKLSDDWNRLLQEDEAKEKRSVSA